MNWSDWFDWLVHDHVQKSKKSKGVNSLNCEIIAALQLLTKIEISLIVVLYTGVEYAYIVN